jgi:hypothetical protein
MIHRRGLLLGLTSLLAAPAIVPVQSLMKLPARKLLQPDMQRLSFECVGLLRGNQLLGPDFVRPMPDMQDLLRFDAVRSFTADGIRWRVNGQMVDVPFVHARSPLIGDSLCIHKGVMPVLLSG